MTSQRAYLTCTAAVFILVALAHVVRLVLGYPVQIGPMSVPPVLSIFGAVGAGALGAWALALRPRT